MSENDVSVIMVSYNTGPILFRSIETVLEQEGLKEIIIIDNGNPEHVRQRLRNWAAKDSRMRIITSSGNIGFAAGCNIGAENAQGKYLLLLNPDCIIPSNAIIRVRQELRKSDDIWLAGCCIVNPDGSEQSGSRRNLLTPWIAFVETFKLYRLLPNNPMLKRMNVHEIETHSEPVTVPAISGAFMMIAKKRYQQLGGIDQGYFFHVEDLDFCFQVNKNGGKIIYVPDIKVVHYRSTSDVSEFFVELNKARGFIRYFMKNFGIAYFPGFIHLVSLGIYARFFINIIVKGLKYVSSLKFLHSKESKSEGHYTIKEKLLERFNDLKDDGKLLINLSDLSGYEPILLVGASGQMGIAVLRRMLACDLKVIALYHNDIIDFSHPNLKWIQGDLNTELNFDGLQPKTIIYTPPLWLLPQHIERLAKSGVKRLIAFSSTSIYGKATSKNIYEQKLVARLVKAEKDIEEQCNQHGINWTIFRPTLIYGIGLDKNISSVVRFIRKFSFFPVSEDGKGLRQPVHCDDLAIATLSVISNRSSFDKAYNLVGGERVSYHDMIEKVFSALSIRARILSVMHLPTILDIFSKISGVDEVNGEIARRMNIDLVFDDSSARTDFSYSPRQFLASGKQDLGII